MKENFSKRIQKVLKFAKEEAVRLGHSYVGSEHLLLGIIKDVDGKAVQVLSSIGFDVGEMKLMIEDLVKPSGGTMTLGHLPLTRRAERILRNTYGEAQKMGKKIAEDVHLLLAIANEADGLASDIFATFSIEYDLLYTFIETSSHPYSKKAEKKKKSNTPTLDLFSRNISKLAEENKLDPVIGRDLEIERVAQILSRRKKNNPVLIGEPGVGKTAIVEGLAIRINENTVPRILWKQRVLALDLAGIIAGTKYRGQFEERMRTLMIELESASEIIVFIDELHTLVGAGSATGSLDAANMFKPALARGEIQVVGATTLDEYRKHIEKDGALERRFQKIMINPPSIDDTIKILEGLRQKYEEHHNIHYSDEAIKACVDLSERYITDKYLPDKAIDVLDEVGSRVHINNINVPDSILKLERKVTKIQKDKEKVIYKQDFEKAAELRDTEKKILHKLNNLQKRWVSDDDNQLPIVDEDEVSNVISMITGIPVQKVAESETERLIHMPDEISKSIIGQNEAIKSISKAIMRSRSGFDNPRRPIGSFMFLGATGVGKTELAKVLARYLFNNDEALVKIDMSEYMERYNVSRLIGAPPGYVGYDEGGQLTERVRRTPYSVVLFDEIEKAHRDVFNILLQILDEGWITDSLGRRVDFRNTIIILTSNLGTGTISSTSFGFVKKGDINEQENIESDIMSEVFKNFNPEFLNRLDELIIFNSLSKSDLFQIVDLLMVDLKNNLDHKNIKLNVTKTAKEYITREIDHREWGARPLRRIIQNSIENVIAEKFLTGEFIETGKITIKASGGKLKFDQSKVKKTKKDKISAGFPMKETG